MTRHTPDFLRQRSSNLSLRMAAAENAASMSQSTTSAVERETRREEPTPKNVKAADIKPENYTTPFCEFLQENPTIFHTVDHFKGQLAKRGYKEVGRLQPPTRRYDYGGLD
jgi:aminopeptidase I